MSTRRPVAVLLVAVAAALTLLTSACASSNSSATAPAAVPVSGSPSQPLATECAGDAVVATYETTYDGRQPLCRGFAGDADHAGEGLAGAGTSDPVGTVVQFMLLHARAIYSFQPAAAWLSALPHPRDVNGFFHRQQAPAPGDTALRAYKDFLTPAPGQTGNERDYALVSVIVSPAPQAEPSGRSAKGGGVWFIGCLVYHSDNHEYLEACPSWVWTVPVVPAVNKRL